MALVRTVARLFPPIPELRILHLPEARKLRGISFETLPSVLPAHHWSSAVSRRSWCFDDADIESAVNAQLAAIFMTSGQSCVAGSRLIISERIKDQFLDQLSTSAKRIVIGDPMNSNTQMGPLCTMRQLNNINRIVSESIESGATLISGGKQLDRPGQFYEPTILDCSSSSDAPSVKTELFGPVLSVQSFDEEEEAVEMANDTRYGLAAGVFTNNLTRAHRMMRKLNAGVVWVNTYRGVSPMAPFWRIRFVWSRERRWN